MLIVIPTLNEILTIDKLVNFLISEMRNINDHDYDIVIADGGSTDGTVDIVKSYSSKYDNIHYIHNAKKIQSSGVNLAVKNYADRHEFLLRVDAHAEYSQGFIQSLILEQINTNADSVVVSMDTQGKHGFQKLVAYAQNSKLGNGNSPHRNSHENGMWVDHGHHALIRISSYLDLGGYDESFVANEDAEFDVRMKRSGYKIWLTSKTRIVYFPRDKPLKLFKQYYNYGFGRANTILKHNVKPNIRQIIPALVAPVVLFSFLVFFDFIFAIPFITWMLACLLLGFVFAPKKDKTTIFIGIPIMIMHFSWSMGFLTLYLKCLFLSKSNL